MAAARALALAAAAASRPRVVVAPVAPPTGGPLAAPPTGGPLAAALQGSTLAAALSGGRLAAAPLPAQPEPAPPLGGRSALAAVLLRPRSSDHLLGPRVAAVCRQQLLQTPPGLGLLRGFSTKPDGDYHDAHAAAEITRAADAYAEGDLRNTIPKPAAGINGNSVLATRLPPLAGRSASALAGAPRAIGGPRLASSLVLRLHPAPLPLTGQLGRLSAESSLDADADDEANHSAAEITRADGVKGKGCADAKDDAPAFYNTRIRTTSRPKPTGPVDIDGHLVLGTRAPPLSGRSASALSAALLGPRAHQLLGAPGVLRFSSTGPCIGNKAKNGDTPPRDTHTTTSTTIPGIGNIHGRKDGTAGEDIAQAVNAAEPATVKPAKDAGEDTPAAAKPSTIKTVKDAVENIKPAKDAVEDIKPVKDAVEDIKPAKDAVEDIKPAKDAGEDTVEDAADAEAVKDVGKETTKPAAELSPSGCSCENIQKMFDTHSKQAKIGRITQTVAIGLLLCAHLIVMAVLAVGYGVAIVVEKAYDKMADLSKDKRTGVIIGNVVSYMFSYVYDQGAATVEAGTAAVGRGAAAVGNGAAAAWDTIAVWRRWKWTKVEEKKEEDRKA